MVTKSDILYTTLIGNTLEIVDSSNKTLIGISGMLVDETREMLVIRSGSELRQILKKIVTLVVTLADKTQVKVEGRLLVGTLAERIKKAK